MQVITRTAAKKRQQFRDWSSLDMLAIIAPDGRLHLISRVSEIGYQHGIYSLNESGQRPTWDIVQERPISCPVDTLTLGELLTENHLPCAIKSGPWKARRATAAGTTSTNSTNSLPRRIGADGKEFNEFAAAASDRSILFTFD